jgi:hypothetical protein
MLRASDVTSTANFGWSVSIRGNYAIVGAPDATNSGGIGAGAAYIFERDGPTWTQVVRLEPTQPYKVEFGWAVSMMTTVLAGAYAVVGDVADPDVEIASGGAYLYKRVGSSWSLVEPKIKADDAQSSANFGSTVHIFGDSITLPSSDGQHFSRGAGMNPMHRDPGAQRLPE